MLLKLLSRFLTSELHSQSRKSTIQNDGSSSSKIFARGSWGFWGADSQVWIKFRSLHIIATLFQVTVQNMAGGERQLHLVLRTQFPQWHGGPRCFIFLWARVLSLPVFRPAVVAPCFSFHVRKPSRCWLYMLWEACSLDSLPVTFTFALVWIPPSVQACWRTIGNHKRPLLTPGYYLLALLRELSQCPRAFT